MGKVYKLNSEKSLAHQVLKYAGWHEGRKVDIEKIELIEKEGEEYLHLLSDWGKEYLFNIEGDITRELAEEMIEYVENKKRKR